MAERARVCGQSDQLVFASITVAAVTLDVHCREGIGNKSTNNEAPKSFCSLGDSGKFHFIMHLRIVFYLMKMLVFFCVLEY